MSEAKSCICRWDSPENPTRRIPVMGCPAHEIHPIRAALERRYAALAAKARATVDAAGVAKGSAASTTPALPEISEFVDGRYDAEFDRILLSMPAGQIHLTRAEAEAIQSALNAGLMESALAGGGHAACGLAAQGLVHRAAQ